MTTLPQLPVPKAEAAREPFAGFLPRTSAIVIDLVLIFFAGYTLEMALREPLMAWGPWLPLASHAAAFGYFWLGNGPVGGGATFGKAIVNLRVVDVTGGEPRIPGYGRALRRALVQFPLMYLALTQFGRSMLDLPPRVGTLADAIVRTGVIALVITHGYSLLTHPQRATWADLWSGTRVTSDPAPADLMVRLKEFEEGPAAQRVTVHRAYSRYFFVAVCLVFGLAFAPILRNPHRAANLALIEEISGETPFSDYELQSVAYLSGRDYAAWKQFMLQEYVPLGTAVEQERARHGGRRREAEPDGAGASDGATTESAGASGVTDGLSAAGTAAASMDAATTESLGAPVLFLGWVKRWGTATPEAMGELAGEMEALRAAAPEYLGRLDAIGVGPEAPAPTRVVCYLSDRFRFVIFSPGKGLVGFIEAPIDPGEGPLRDAWYEPAP